MPHYQVSLYKDLLSSDGHPFHCLQGVVFVDADAPEGAAQLVIKDMRGGARDWSVEVMEWSLAPPLPAATGSTAKLA